jgi:hypothetical protein
VADNPGVDRAALHAVDAAFTREGVGETRSDRLARRRDRRRALCPGYYRAPGSSAGRCPRRSPR